MLFIGERGGGGSNVGGIQEVVWVENFLNFFFFVEQNIFIPQ